MLTLRFNFAVMVSLLFHFGIVFYCLSAEKTRHAQIYTPIKAAIISIALTQNVIEKQISDVTLNNKLTGGLLSEPQQNENAVIKVANKKSTHSDKNKVSDVQKKVIEKKEQKQPNKKVIKRKEQQQNKKNDDVKQEQQAGQNSTLSNAAGEQGAQNTRAVGDNISANYQSYIDKLRREIERHKRYPRKARNTHIQGKVLVNFTLTSSGEITRVSIAKSSMHTQLDQAALTAIAKSRPVGIPPEGLKKQITLSIEFEL
ncbi:TPA: TonB family protein [Providencia rettgeri]